MQRFYSYGRKRRKVKDVSDVLLPGAATQMDAKRLMITKTRMQKEMVLHYIFMNKAEKTS